jgi:predicted ATP-dependent protease
MIKKYFTKEERKKAISLDKKKYADKIKEIKKQKRLKYELENKEELLKIKLEKLENQRIKRNQKRKERYEKNKEKENSEKRKRYLKNKEHYIKVENERKKGKMQSDPFYKFTCITRQNIKRSFSRNNTIKFKKLLKTEKLLGCSIIEFSKFILSKCPEGTTFKDFKQFGYHLDHIVPISSATTQEEVEKLCHYTNYQPLWWKDNITKSNKILN